MLQLQKWAALALSQENDTVEAFNRAIWYTINSISFIQVKDGNKTIASVKKSNTTCRQRSFISSESVHQKLRSIVSFWEKKAALCYQARACFKRVSVMFMGWIMLLYLVCTSQQMQCMFLLTYSDKAVFCALVLRRLLSPLLQRFFLRLNILRKEDKSVGVITLSSSVSHHSCSSARKTHAPCLTSLEYTYTLYSY